MPSMTAERKHCIKSLEPGDTVYNVYKVPGIGLRSKFRINCPGCRGYSDLFLIKVRDTGLGQHGFTGVIEDVISINDACED